MIIVQKDIKTGKIQTSGTREIVDGKLIEVKNLIIYLK
jgi:hypothetical protein